MAAPPHEPPGKRPGDSSSSTGPTIAGRYRVIRGLGKGSTAAVYLAEDSQTHRQVALKILLQARLDRPVSKQRFQLEGEASWRIHHPNVVEVLDWGDAAGGSLYLAMEYLQGETLKRYIRRQHILPWAHAAPILLQVCAAMEAAHLVNVVHRDLKPDNIMLIERDGSSRFVKVMDFGLAKLLEEADARKLTKTGIVVGTPAFLAPEQIRGYGIDRCTDIYALGAIMYRMLCGSMPFTATSPLEMMRLHLNEQPRSPRERNPDANIPPAAAAIACKALAKDPADRFASMLEMARAIAQIPPR